jgi:hypothetical protein
MRLIPILALPLALLPLASLPGAVAAQTAEAPLALPAGGLAEAAPAHRALFEAMGLYEILSVMATEGQLAAPDIEADMFPGQGGSAWPAVVAGIYAPDRLVAAFEAAVPVERLTPEMVAELQAFYDTATGRAVAAGEVAARQAFLTPGVEEEATERARAAAAAGDARIALLTEFIAVNDLVERNVSGALNSNFAFYRGLSAGGAFAAEIPEELMLADVWSQEPEIRTTTTEWLYAYQILAYENLSDEDLRAYTAMTATPAGQALNAALFTAFDAVFEGVSANLGAAAARFIAGEDT